MAKSLALATTPVLAEMGTFDSTSFALHLAAARERLESEDHLRLSFANILFDPAKHPRGIIGRFSIGDAGQLEHHLASMGEGETHQINNTVVSKTDRGTIVVDHLHGRGTVGGGYRNSTAKNLILHDRGLSDGLVDVHAKMLQHPGITDVWAPADGNLVSGRLANGNHVIARDRGWGKYADQSIVEETDPSVGRRLRVSGGSGPSEAYDQYMALVQRTRNPHLLKGPLAELDPQRPQRLSQNPSEVQAVRSLGVDFDPRRFQVHLSRALEL